MRPDDQFLHGGHDLNVEELHLAYVRTGVLVHRSRRAAMSALGGSVSSDLAGERGRYEGQYEPPEGSSQPGGRWRRTSGPASVDDDDGGRSDASG